MSIAPSFSWETIPTADGLRLPGFFFVPAQPSHRAIIWLHGNGSSSVFYQPERHQPLAQAFAAAGFAYLAFNNRGAHVVKMLERAGRDIPYGMAYELIEEARLDCQAAMTWLEEQGYTEIYLMGHSTGANKICLYHFLEVKNAAAGYILLGGADDMGLYYAQWGDERFWAVLAECQQQIAAGHGQMLVPETEFPGLIISYQSLFDTINPEGAYNIFPFYEGLQGIAITKKKRFQEYLSVDKPLLVVYGENDEFCFGAVDTCIQQLQAVKPASDRVSYATIPGADHGFHNKTEELARAIVDWLDKKTKKVQSTAKNQIKLV